MLPEEKPVEQSQRSAVDFVQGVHLALAAGAHLCARQLATQGAELYPEDSELQKMVHILAPPRCIKEDKMKHTPGPWLACGLAVWTEHDEDPRRMGELICTSSARLEQRVANTHLIAAAPDLLAACEAWKQVDKIIPRMRSEGASCHDTHQEYKEAVDVAKLLRDLALKKVCDG